MMLSRAIEIRLPESRSCNRASTIHSFKVEFGSHLASLCPALSLPGLIGEPEEKMISIPVMTDGASFADAVQVSHPGRGNNRLLSGDRGQLGNRQCPKARGI